MVLGIVCALSGGIFLNLTGEEKYKLAYLVGSFILDLFCAMVELVLRVCSIIYYNRKEILLWLYGVLLMIALAVIWIGHGAAVGAGKLWRRLSSSVVRKKTNIMYAVEQKKLLLADKGKVLMLSAKQLTDDVKLLPMKVRVEFKVALGICEFRYHIARYSPPKEFWAYYFMLRKKQIVEVLSPMKYTELRTLGKELKVYSPSRVGILNKIAQKIVEKERETYIGTTKED